MTGDRVTVEEALAQFWRDLKDGRNSIAAFEAAVREDERERARRLIRAYGEAQLGLAKTDRMGGSESREAAVSEAERAVKALNAYAYAEEVSQ